MDGVPLVECREVCSDRESDCRTERVSGDEDIAASVVVVLLEFLNQYFHEFLAFLEPRAVTKSVCDAILLSSRASWKLFFFFPVPWTAMTRRGAPLQGCSMRSSWR